MSWPPRFCRKGKEKNCVGPYRQIMKKEKNPAYKKDAKAGTLASKEFFEVPDYEIGYNWS